MGYAAAMSDTEFFFELSPDRVLEAVEAGGFLPTGHCFALNALENRVYDVRLEDDRHVVAKFYRPGRWSPAAILEEHRLLRALAMAAHGTSDEAIDAVRQTLAYATERGLWSWVLAGLGTAANVFESAGRPDAAATVLGARHGADYRSGFTAGLVLLQEAGLRADHPEDFQGWWDAGHRLSPAEAGAFAIRTAEHLLAEQTG